jgi:hypothetical protein
MIPTRQENENAAQELHATNSHSWEEDDAEPQASKWDLWCGAVLNQWTGTEWS